MCAVLCARETNANRVDDALRARAHSKHGSGGRTDRPTDRQRKTGGAERERGELVARAAAVFFFFRIAAAAAATTTDSDANDEKPKYDVCVRLRIRVRACVCSARVSQYAYVQEVSGGVPFVYQQMIGGLGGCVVCTT